MSVHLIPQGNPQSEIKHGQIHHWYCYRNSTPVEFEPSLIHRLPVDSRHSQRLSMVRYTTVTATEIRPQWDSDPVFSTTFQLIADMRLSDYPSTMITKLLLLLNQLFPNASVLKKNTIYNLILKHKDVDTSLLKPIEFATL